MYRFIASVVMALFVLVASYNMAYALEIKKYTWIDFETKMQWLKEDMNMCIKLATNTGYVSSNLFSGLDCYRITDEYINMREERDKAFQVGKPGEYEDFPLE